jgi:hypothetical protein
MEISTGASGTWEFEPVCAETSAFSVGMPIRWRAFAVLLISPLTASNSRLGQSVRSTLEFRARGKLSL